MSEYLSPAEVEAHAQHEESLLALRLAATLREMAAVVAAVATADYSDEYCCQLCDKQVLWDGSGHKPTCPAIRARKLMGLEP